MGIEIVKVQPQQNAEHHQCDAGEAAIVKQKDGGVDFEDEVGRENERRGDQQNLGDQQRQRANWYEDLKQTNHRWVGLRVSGKVNYTRDCGSHPSDMVLCD